VDLSFTLEYIGDALRAGGRRDAAHGSYRRALELRQTAQREDPADAELRARLASLFVRLGRLQMERRQTPRADSCREARSLYEAARRLNDPTLSPPPATLTATLEEEMTALSAALSRCSPASPPGQR
jgi:hypothetical protein